MTTTTGVTAQVAETSVNVQLQVIDEVSSATTTLAVEPTLIETIIQFITSLF